MSHFRHAYSRNSRVIALHQAARFRAPLHRVVSYAASPNLRLSVGDLSVDRINLSTYLPISIYHARRLIAPFRGSRFCACAVYCSRLAAHPARTVTWPFSQTRTEENLSLHRELVDPSFELANTRASLHSLSHSRFMTNYRPLSEERVACVIDKVIHRSLESYEEQVTTL
jgi:hypothetical protein